MAITLKLLAAFCAEQLATMFTPGTIVTRTSEGKSGKKGLILFYDKDKKKYAVKWPKRRHYVSPGDLTEIVCQATLF